MPKKADKYGYLFKKLEYHELPGGGKKPEYLTWNSGAMLEGLPLTFFWSYHNRIGKWGAGGEFGHVHSAGEVFLFTGLDYDNPNRMDAEVELSIGEKAETHVIASPSIVVVPPGVPHLPMVTTKANKPFGFMAITLSAEEKTKELKKRDKAFILADEYGPAIRRMEMKDIHRKEGGNADHFFYWNGKKDEGFVLNFTWAFHKGTGYWHRDDPHVHPNDEVLIFLGMDPERPDYLGAEIEFRMGEEQEVHVFDTPTAVIAPKGLVHCPLITRKVEQPYAFTAICLAHEHATTQLGGKEWKG
jgi:hypothetical protein